MVVRIFLPRRALQTKVAHQPALFSTA